MVVQPFSSPDSGSISILQIPLPFEVVVLVPISRAVKVLPPSVDFIIPPVLPPM